jgi:small GTP-binding protein
MPPCCAPLLLATALRLTLRAPQTTWLYRLQTGEHRHTNPTIVSNFEEIVYKNVKLSVWDLGGQASHRTLWKYHFQGTKGLLFAVDSSDRQRLPEAKRELHELLLEDKLQDVLVVVLANKQDRPDSLSAQEVSDFLALSSVLGSNRRWFVQPTSATCGEGVHEAMDWILANMGEGGGGEGGTGRKGAGILVDKGRHYPERHIKVAQSWRDRLLEEEREQLQSPSEPDNYHGTYLPPVDMPRLGGERATTPTEDLMEGTESVNLLMSQYADVSQHESEAAPADPRQESEAAAAGDRRHESEAAADRRQAGAKTTALLPAPKAPEAYRKLGNGDDEEEDDEEQHAAREASGVLGAWPSGGVSGGAAGAEATASKVTAQPKNSVHVHERYHANSRAPLSGGGGGGSGFNEDGGGGEGTGGELASVSYVRTDSAVYIRYHVCVRACACACVCVRACVCMCVFYVCVVCLCVCLYT